MENRLFAQTFSFDEEFKSYLAQQFATVRSFFKTSINIVKNSTLQAKILPELQVFNNYKYNDE